MHHTVIFVCAYVLRQMSIHPFLTNLEDEISVKGGRICKAQNLYKKKIYNNNNKTNIYI
jgi:hypothetical protein